ncbi:MAG: hypothetical protein ABIN25_02935 [Ginsengibacter sp.]
MERNKKRNVKKILWLIVLSLLLVAGVSDIIRYARPTTGQKQIVLPAKTFPVATATKIILVYNAWGGIYPGIADIIHKEFFPSSYPCNLCFLSFGTFGIKDEWQHFLDSLSYQKIELHKDEFKRNYQPANMPLPAILLRGENKMELLLSAGEINTLHTLPQLIDAVRNKLRPE